MAEIKYNELSKELIEKAAACKSVEELLALARENDISITAEEAQAYLDEISSVELDLDSLDHVAGGSGCRECYLINNCPSNFQGDQCENKLPCESET